MIKKMLSVILSLSFVMTYGQITVTHMDMMFIGDEYYQGEDDSPSIILGTPGGNKIWNFSFLNAIDQDTVSIVSPAVTPYASSYPNADLCMVETEDGWSGSTTNHTYMTKNSTGLYVLGEEDVVLPSQSMFVPFPLNYGDTYVDGPISAEDQMYSGWQLDWYFPDTLAPVLTLGTCHTIDSALVSAVITNTFNVDAWGTATMPDGNDYDALRVAVEQDYSYTIQVYCSDTLSGVNSGWFPAGGDSDISNEIHFISNHMDIRHSLVTLVMDSIYVESARFLNGSTLSSINTIDVNSFNVYPIPASYNVTIETVLGSNENSFELYNISGMLIDKQKFNQSTDIDLSSLAKGTYVLKIHNSDGHINKKIIVK